MNAIFDETLTPRLVKAFPPAEKAVPVELTSPLLVPAR